MTIVTEPKYLGGGRAHVGAVRLTVAEIEELEREGIVGGSLVTGP